MIQNHKNPKVSVIIPIYNTEKYLREALDSICNQTLKELQIILINDGSTDKCQEIIEEYAHQDSRIEWYIQENAGQGYARNRGLEHAKGEYIYFMDSDDILDTRCLEICYNTCKAEDLDYVTFDADSFSLDGSNANLFNYNRNGQIDSTIIWNSQQLLVHALSNDSFRATVYLFLFNHKFIEKYSVLFPEGIIHEDNLFVLHAMLTAKRCKYLPNTLFHRRVRQSSTMTNKFSIRNIHGYIGVSLSAKQLRVDHPEWKPTIELYLHKTLNSVIWLGHQLSYRDKLITSYLFIRNNLWYYANIKSWLAFWFKFKF